MKRMFSIFAGLILFISVEGLTQTSPQYVDEGNALLSSGKFVESIDKYSKALEIDAQNKYAYGNRGLAKRNLKKYNDAIKDYDEAIKIDPAFAWAYASRADVKVELKKYDEAILDLNKAIELNPQDDYNYYLRGNAKNYQEKHSDAVLDYNKAIEINPQYAWHYIMRADSKTKLAQYESVLDDYNKALELKPDLAWAQFRKGMLEYFLERLEHLKTFYTTAKKDPPLFVDNIILHLLGKITDVQVVDSTQTFKGQAIPENLCEGSFYIGMNAFVKGDEKLARKYWNYCLKTRVTNFIEYSYAGTYLKKLKKE